MNDKSPIAVLHPGAMGAAVGRAVTGAPGWWVSDGRGSATRQRAHEAGLIEVPDFAALRDCRAVLSICPPSVAQELAARVAETEFRGIYLDANAISPERAVRLGEVVRPGVTVVDGGIVGPPPRTAGTTRLYLSGPEDAVREVAALFDGGPLRVVALDGPVGRASALKVAFAAYNKLTYALAAQSYALAARHGVDADLRELAGAELPDTPLGAPGQLTSAGQRAWRWEGEMAEIADACSAAGLAPELVTAVQEMFARWQDYRDDPDVTVDALLAAIARPG
ncbi:NAD(P)-dependent oxidoreductase [Amycolatopsis jejuensis]|uniref:NAD(P)-dependent oxidoreductase n=1 Tax=Amycolatopsis jejuensis TaxID=330084 RepID=UPI00138E47F2|nr:NAD(P)-dependent oxidoreductase [Amycolatopsis jejuensis]